MKEFEIVNKLSKKRKVLVEELNSINFVWIQRWCNIYFFLKWKSINEDGIEQHDRVQLGMFKPKRGFLKKFYAQETESATMYTSLQDKITNHITCTANERSIEIYWVWKNGFGTNIYQR